jgi:Spy/CpxP family protein refolding chaperone
VLHYTRVMAQKLRNVTVTLEETVAHWARMEAARQETSVSRLLGALLKERMLQDRSYDSAMRRALARKSFAKSDARYLSREEAHDRAGLR